MKNYYKFITLAFAASLLSFTSCTKDDEPEGPVDPGESSSELLAKKFTTAPNLDGDIDEIWGTAQRLVSSVEVPQLGPRMTYLNSDGAGVEEELGLFFPSAGESYNFQMRAGYTATDIYFLIEWDDADDSKDRQSWYFDSSSKTWKGEHKYANDANDKFYEDKFSFLFPIGEVAGFSASTCYATCHTAQSITTPKDKHTRHYLNNEGEKIDMWHWKRVRGTYLGQVDDQKMVYDDASKGSGANGRKGDATGSGGYSNNSQDLGGVTVPKYVIPGQSGYYWIDQDQIENGTAKLITAVDANGVLSYDGGTIDPSTGGFEQGSGNMRIPSVTTKPFTEGRGDISITAVHTGSKWICEVTRKLNTGDADDVVFDANNELDFGFAIFNNAAIAHAVKPNLKLRFEQ